MNNYFLNPYSIPYLLVGLLTIAEGVFIYLQNRRSVINVSYALCCSALAIWLTGVAAIYFSKDETLSLAWARYYCFLGIIFVTPAVHLFSVCWQETPASANSQKPSLMEIFNNRPVLKLSFLLSLLFYVLCTSSNLIVEKMWHYPWGNYPKAGKGYVALVVWFYILLSMAISNFLSIYRTETSLIKKKQVKLIIIAFSIGFLGSIEFLPNFGIRLYPCAFITEFICITMVGYCVIRYRLMDIETAIHKTIMWFLSFSIILIPLFIVFKWTLNYTDSAISEFGLWLVSLLIILLYLHTIQPRIDHFFQRRQANLERISRRFSDDLVHLSGLDDLVKRIKDMLYETLYPQNVEVYCRDEHTQFYKLMVPGQDTPLSQLDIKEPLSSWMIRINSIIDPYFLDLNPEYAEMKDDIEAYCKKTKAALIIPLVLNEKLIGVMNLGKKANLKRYNHSDLNFLRTVKNEATIAISNSLLYQNIEEQVKQRTRELVDVQKQLIQAEKLATVGTLAGGVAHEINNPLTAVLTNVQMLLSFSPETLDEDSLESLRLIEEATKRCRTIVQKLMTYAKKPLEQTQMVMLDPRKALQNVVSFLDYQMKQENITLKTEIADSPQQIKGNQNEIEQVITNIILNAKDAIKQVKKSGTIDVNLKQEDKYIRLEIKDDGAGIPKEILGKIFDPFFTTKDVGKGLGLGLSICQGIIEKHKGTITVSSQQNKGSIFCIRLPLAGTTADSKEIKQE